MRSCKITFFNWIKNWRSCCIKNAVPRPQPVLDWLVPYNQLACCSATFPPRVLVVILNSFVPSAVRNKPLIVKSIDLGARLPGFNPKSTTYWRSDLDKLCPLSARPCPQSATWKSQWFLVRALCRWMEVICVEHLAWCLAHSSGCEAHFCGGREHAVRSENKLVP